ncbi:MAG TPA: ribonuclease P protein component [Roseiarcus sp.]|nr:ribonuclease P protein component [Roseiarcus sp.]
MELQFPDKNSEAAPAAEAVGRLRRRADFQRVARGRRKALEAFTLQALRRAASDDGWTGPRVGFTVTRKVGNAVVRNRIRRRLKEAVRAARRLEAEADHDYVLIARREALGRSFAALVEDLRQAFRAVKRNARDTSRPAAQTAAKGRDRRS